MIFLDEQLHFLHFLQEFRAPVRSLLLFFNFFDSDIYALVLVLIMWIFFSRKWAVRLGFLICIDAFVNFVIKLSLGLPRPSVFDASLPMVQTSTQHGCPSGGAELAFLVGSLFLYNFRKKYWAWPLGLSYILLISFSRLFLGVHFPVDVLGGWVVAFFVLIIFLYSVEPIEQLVSKWPGRVLLSTLGIILLLYLIWPYAAAAKWLSAMAILATILFLLRETTKNEPVKYS